MVDLVADQATVVTELVGFHLTDVADGNVSW
jgi:hypothetical protein